MARNSTDYWYTQSALIGNVAALLDSDAAIVEGYTYDVYGKATVRTAAGNDGTWFTADDTTSAASALGNPYTFTGRRLDGETGWMYYRHRMYDPVRGRFGSRDPLGYAAGIMNAYEYAASRTPAALDPLGLHSSMIDAEQEESWYKMFGLLYGQDAREAMEELGRASQCYWNQNRDCRTACNDPNIGKTISNLAQRRNAGAAFCVGQRSCVCVKDREIAGIGTIKVGECPINDALHARHELGHISDQIIDCSGGGDGPHQGRMSQKIGARRNAHFFDAITWSECRQKARDIVLLETLLAVPGLLHDKCLQEADYMLRTRKGEMRSPHMCVANEPPWPVPGGTREKVYRAIELAYNNPATVVWGEEEACVVYADKTRKCFKYE